MEIGEKIKKIRKEKNITQEELANKLNVKRSVISKYENGVVAMKLDTIEKIAEALEIDSVDLVFNEEKATLFKEQKTEKVNLAFYEFEEYTDRRIEEDLIKKYRKLNFIGKQKAKEYIIDLSEQEKYTTPDEE